MVEIAIGIVNNEVLILSVIAWFFAQAIKFLLEMFKNKSINPRLFISSGGMPSSHTSFVVAMATAIGFKEGFDSTAFAISAVMTMVVMYDAAGVRLAAGKQAAAINMLIEKLNNPNISIDTKLKELLGHTPLQVLAGCILGFVVATVGSNI